jgi:type IV pilus assembly protein PilP
MKRKSRSWIGVVACGAALLLATDGWAQKTALPVQQPQAAADTYRYTPAGKPDPFKPFMELNKAVGTKKMAAQGKGGPISPLQNLPLEQFTLVGIAVGKDSRVAMMEDKVAKKFYPVVSGTYIGQNSGRVTEILADRIIVEERVRAGGGRAKAKRIPILLHKDQEVKP